MWYVLANLKTVQQLMNLPNSIDTLVVMLSDNDEVNKIEPIIKQKCAKYGLEYRRWDQLVPYYNGAKEFIKSGMRIATVIILIIAIFAIANTMTMNLFERLREFGMMRAMGTTRSQTLRIFIAEGILIAIIGSLLGVILAVALAQINNALGGISLPPPPGSARGYQLKIDIAALNCLEYFVTFVACSFLSVMFPAIKAAKLSITEALRWI